MSHHGKRNIALTTCLIILHSLIGVHAQQQRAREWGIHIGVLPIGQHNAITDVMGVKVGHHTLLMGDSVRTGVTAVLPHEGNIFQQKVPAAVYVGNGFGKLVGTTQIQELGTLESPIILTNTLSVAAAMEGTIDYLLKLEGNENVGSVNAVVGETNDGYLNDIRGRHVKAGHVLAAIEKAHTGPVEEGGVGAGTGTVCFGYKGGMGTASRQLPKNLGGYTVGVIVQTNFGGVLQIAGVNIGKEMGKFSYSGQLQKNEDGSCMIVVATDAPLDSRNLARLAKRAFMGLAKTGGIASNGSGDYVIAFSTAEQLRLPHESDASLEEQSVLRNDLLSPVFMAAIEATEEAIINSLFMGQTTTGMKGRTVEALPLHLVLHILRDHGVIHP